MLEKSLATLFALLILATLINRFLLWRLPERKGWWQLPGSEKRYRDWKKW